MHIAPDISRALLTAVFSLSGFLLLTRGATLLPLFTAVAASAFTALSTFFALPPLLSRLHISDQPYCTIIQVLVAVAAAAIAAILAVFFEKRLRVFVSAAATAIVAAFLLQGSHRDLPYLNAYIAAVLGVLLTMHARRFPETAFKLSTSAVGALIVVASIAWSLGKFSLPLLLGEPYGNGLVESQSQGHVEQIKGIPRAWAALESLAVLALTLFGVAVQSAWIPRQDHPQDDHGESDPLVREHDREHDREHRSAGTSARSHVSTSAV
mmetsp:Transcript_10153/g.25447  ORF Transcript_10153/g.25447 Transcript_10153/m.25447 type:complete len:267 (-) Transcript_10153:163-963(-)